MTQNSTASEMNLEQIQKAIPHRAPMLLVDEIVSQDDNQIVCRKTISADEFFLQGHYPDSPVVPGIILCEFGMQSGAILLSRHLDEATAGVPVATRLNNVRFRKMIRPGDRIEAHVSLTERLADAFFLEAKILHEGKTAVRFDFACTIAHV
jgi:3-hydroxyacyl-[acyl-carrier-protein] dehydratase